MIGDEVPRVLYFAYCVNMLGRRMKHCIDPEAKNVGIVKLPDHTLYFGRWSEMWHGRLPTILPQKGSVVWGTLWDMRECKIGQLDLAQGVGRGFYRRVPIQVFSQRAKAPPIDAITYKLKSCDEVKYKCGKPMKRYRPSYLYKSEMVEAAEDSNFPVCYKKYLKKIPHNGYTGSVPPIFDDEDTEEGEEVMTCMLKSEAFEEIEANKEKCYANKA